MTSFYNYILDVHYEIHKRKILFINMAMLFVSMPTIESVLLQAYYIFSQQVSHWF